MRGLFDDSLVFVDYKRDLKIFETEEIERARAYALREVSYGP